MPPIRLTPPSGRYLSFVEREEIAIMNAVDCGESCSNERLSLHVCTLVF